MITERQEQIENAVELLEGAVYHLLHHTSLAFDLADTLAIRIMRRCMSELQAEFNDVTVKNQNNS